MSESQPAVDLGSLISAHHAELYGYAYRILGKRDLAEDMTQQTFLQAQAKLAQLRDPASARGWLFSIMRNAIQMTWRQGKRLPVETGEVNLDQLPIDDEPAEFDHERLQAALNELSDEHRLILVLFYFEECSYCEISQRLNLPMGTVMSRLSRAKSQLRTRLLAREELTLRAPR